MALIRDVLFRAQELLQDKAAARWSVADLARYYNQAALLLAVKRPDVAKQFEPLTLVAGPRQSLPAGGLMLMDIPYNTTGSQRAIRRVDATLLDMTVPGWRSAPQAAEIAHYAYDLREPRVFWVYPPATNTAAVALLYSKEPARIPENPATLSEVTGDLPFSAEWATALAHAVAFFAYSGDVEVEANLQLAALHMQQFNTMVGEQLQTASTAVKG